MVLQSAQYRFKSQLCQWGFLYEELIGVLLFLLIQIQFGEVIICIFLKAFSSVSITIFLVPFRKQIRKKNLIHAFCTLLIYFSLSWMSGIITFTVSLEPSRNFTAHSKEPFIIMWNTPDHQNPSHHSNGYLLCKILPDS